ncbi:MAG: ABC transporter permease [Ilumatobacteraceae bacterium]
MTGAAFPSSIRLAGAQVRHQLVMFRRTPVALFFTLVLPLMMLVLFNSLFGGSTITVESGDEWPVRQFYTGGLAVFTAVTATYTNLANMVPIRREEGVLKRWRSTPLPTGACLSGFVGSSVVLATIGAALMLVIGWAFYGLDVDPAELPAAAVTFVVGVSSFAALGMMVAALVPSAASAGAVANATILPLAFVSNVFIVTGDDTPSWMTTVGNFFPLRPFVESFQDAFNPYVDAPLVPLERMGYVAVWGVLGLVIAVRRFSWEPRPGAATTRRRRASSQQSGTDGAPSA